MAVYPKHKSSELLGLIFMAFSVLLVLSLLSYNALDGSMNVSSRTPGYSNFIGKSGAWTADFLFQFLGLPAFILPLSLLFLGYRKLRGQPVEYPFIKVVGVVGTLLALAAMLSLLSWLLPVHLDHAPGGVIGMLVGNLLRRYLNTAGALIVLLTSLLVAVTLTTRFSIEAVLAWLSSRRLHIFPETMQRYRGWQKSRQDRKELDRLKTSRTNVTNQPPPVKLTLRDQELIKDSVRQEQPPARPTLNWEPVLKNTASESHAETSGSKARAGNAPYKTPALDFLQPASQEIAVNEAELMDRAEKLTAKFAEFDVMGRVLQIHPGPVVTTFEFKPDPGIKYSRITSLVDDLCLALKAESIRIDRIPGKNTVGIEVPNIIRQTIYLREILSSAAFQQSESLLTLGLGKLINGNTYVTDLARMPHLLIAGATGAGKSVGLNCLVCSLLYKASPEHVRFIMIDPKRLELGLYEDIPHLLTPIVTDPKQASNALNWAVREMEERYKLLAAQGVRNLAQYNRLAQQGKTNGDSEEKLEPLPLIVLIVDELADLMMTSGKEVEASLTRLAQMARAIGIHLILATQRPSVDVITGLIKANFPSRVAFRVSSKIDSRTILDGNGAEQLLGQGDMLFLSPGTSRPVRVHGGLVTEKEIRNLTRFLKQQGQPDYREEILEGPEESESGLLEMENLEDSLYDDAARFVVESGRASTSLLQRRLRIGYGRAARLLDMMEHEGIISPPDGSKAREVLVPSNYFEEVDSGA